MRVLGISGSPRANGSTTKLVKEVLAGTEEETEFITLAGKNIGPCRVCLACAKDNICKVQDGFTEIREKMIKADALVIGGSNMFNMINGLTHNFLERFYQFYHRSLNPLKNKPAVTIGMGGGSGEPVLKSINHILRVHSINIVDSLSANGAVPCFDCGLGHNCNLSNAKYAITEEGQLNMNLKPDIDKQIELKQKAKEIGKKLGLIIKGGK